MNCCPAGLPAHFGTLLLGCVALWMLEAGGEEISGCYGATVTISCGTGDKKINILGDFYGLSSPDANPRVCAYSDHDICVIPSHSHSSVVKQMCNGRTNCIFTISEKHTCMNSVKETTYQQIKYECIPASEIRSMCDDAEWSSHSGFLTSANYPIFYPPRASCSCTLYTEDASFILLKTAELRLKASKPCRDFLRVQPALNPDEVLCGSVHRIYEARSFKLHFHTRLTSYKGFLLSYEAASVVKIRCASDAPSTTTPAAGTSNVTSQSPSGVIPGSPHDVIAESAVTSPGAATLRTTEQTAPTYPSDMSPSVKAPVRAALHTVSGCFGDIVHFQCKDGELLRVVQDMYGTAPGGRCTYQPGDCAVQAVGQKSIVSQICSSKTRCMNFIVTRTFCGERVTSYQEISYECVPATALIDVCSETVITTSHGFLTSPNFPGMYPRNLSCSCTLRAARGSASPMVRLELAHFTLHDLMDCEDWLEVDLGDGNPSRTLCGSQHGHFSGTSIHLDFRTDAKHSHSGFWLDFKGDNDTMIVMACNVPVELVWPNDVTSPPPTTATTTTSHTTTTTTASPSPIHVPGNESAIPQMGDNRSMEMKSLMVIDHQPQTENETVLLSHNDVDTTLDDAALLVQDGGNKSTAHNKQTAEVRFQDGSFVEDDEIASIEDDEPINDSLLEKEEELEPGSEEEFLSLDDLTTETPDASPILRSSSGSNQRVFAGFIFTAGILSMLG